MRRFALLTLLLGCASAAPSNTPEPAPVPSPVAALEPQPAAATTPDGPHISSSDGEPGGVVVLWPRIIPKSDAPDITALAGQLQQQLKQIASQAGATAVDVRPQPQRVCRKPDGCKAASLGVLLTHKQGGCTALALIASPGASPTHIEPWAGKVELKEQQVPFRAYPESQVVVVDFVPCKELASALDERRPAILAKLREAMKK